MLFYSFPELKNYIYSNARVTCSGSVVGDGDNEGGREGGLGCHNRAGEFA